MEQLTSPITAADILYCQNLLERNQFSHMYQYLGDKGVGYAKVT